MSIVSESNDLVLPGLVSTVPAESPISPRTSTSLSQADGSVTVTHAVITYVESFNSWISKGFRYTELYQCVARGLGELCIGSLKWFLSRTCTSVRDGPPRVKETRGIALTRPVKPSEGTDQIGPPRTTHVRTLNKHLPIQEKPGLKPGYPESQSGDSRDMIVDQSTNVR